MQLPRLVFLGTPDFAVPSLRRLSEAGADILLVVTQPDRPSGRGKKLTPPPVKVLAEELGIPVYQPERIRRKEALEHVLSFGAECAAVVAYGQILPQAFLDGFPLGALNVHGSLLPKYRGAAPIHRSILAGDAETGISIMLLDAGMDTGPVLTEQAVPIELHDNLGTMHDKLANVGAELLCRTLADWKAGRIQPRPQDDSLATLAPPIKKEEMAVSWQLPAQRVFNTIRAFDPFPGAFTSLGGKRLKCFRASILPWKGEGSPGEVIGETEEGLAVLAGDGRVVAIGELQLEGQRRLPASQFLRGRPVAPGTRLE